MGPFRNGRANALSLTLVVCHLSVPMRVDFGNPDAELMTRWFQAAAYHPFFRGHAHHDAKTGTLRFGEPHTERLRQAIISRYQLLLMVYSFLQIACKWNTCHAPIMDALPR